MTGAGHREGHEKLERAGLEEALSQMLNARAVMVRTEPDLGDLSERLERSRRSRPRVSLLTAAAALVLVATGGGLLGSYLAPAHTEHTVLSAAAGGRGGALTNQSSQRGIHQASSGAGMRYISLRSPSLQFVPSIERTTTSGTHLAAVADWQSPVSIVSGTSLSGCYQGELVSTTVTGAGAVATGAGVVALQPLSRTGIEVVDSGTARGSHGRDLWWATVAVGAAVARVAAEQPDGVEDAMRPKSGLAVVGGVTEEDEASRYFSVVAEDAAGRSFHSIGFLTGSAARVVGAATGAAASDSSVSGCSTPRQVVPEVKTLGSQPSTPLLAAASVVAAFDSAYSGAQRTGGVEVTAVTFLSATEADVVYHFGRGRPRTGTAVSGSLGNWLVTGATICADLLGRDGPAVSLPEHASSCR